MKKGTFFLLLQGESIVNVRCEVLMVVPVTIMGFQNVMCSRDFTLLVYQSHLCESSSLTLVDGIDMLS